MRYVDKGSNHPDIILQNIPYGINKRLSSISSNEECFNEHKDTYQQAINAAGYSNIVSYQKGKQKRPKLYCDKWKQREKGNQEVVDKNEIFWLDPPFNLYCAENIGNKISLDLVDKHLG